MDKIAETQEGPTYIDAIGEYVVSYNRYYYFL